ncbi:hypothetical protein SAY86_002855 [Trapa natans]|uniref:Uncharacterized protein n=1 Tax=Trapa natans TaxID=22666 RepID=A0AAN7R3S9_TRANT|nr:hypothetical protein SAY86_002855 [Trapa natans]
MANYSTLMRPIFSAESLPGYYYEAASAAEKSSKRQVFLRSYQFSRKRSLSERIRRSLALVKRLVWSRLRSARKLRQFVWAKLWKLRQGLSCRRRPPRFVRLLKGNYYHYSNCNIFPCLF